MIWIASWLVLTTISPFREMYAFRWRLPFFLLFGVALFYGAYGFLKPAQAMARLFDEMTVFANRENDTLLQNETSLARRRAWPGRGSFYVLVTVLLVSILASGIRGGLFFFLFGAIPQ